jgi:hypothetical protein
MVTKIVKPSHKPNKVAKGNKPFKKPSKLKHQMQKNKFQAKKQKHMPKQ